MKSSPAVPVVHGRRGVHVGFGGSAAGAAPDPRHPSLRKHVKERRVDGKVATPAHRREQMLDTVQAMQLDNARRQGRRRELEKDLALDVWRSGSGGGCRDRTRVVALAAKDRLVGRRRPLGGGNERVQPQTAVTRQLVTQLRVGDALEPVRD